MKPQSAKAKGRKLQQWVRDRIISLFALDPSDVRSTSMGAGGADVTLSAHAKRMFPFVIECKSRAAIAVYRDYEQALAHADKEWGEPLLIIKENGSAPLAVVDATYFFEMALQLQALREAYDDK